MIHYPVTTKFYKGFMLWGVTLDRPLRRACDWALTVWRECIDPRRMGMEIADPSLFCVDCKAYMRSLLRQGYLNLERTEEYLIKVTVTPAGSAGRKRPTCNGEMVGSNPTAGSDAPGIISEGSKLRWSWIQVADIPSHLGG